MTKTVGTWRLAAGGIVAVTFIAASGGTANAGILEQFQGGGQAQTEFVPSDMGGAVGDGYVMQTVNGVVSIYNSGNGHLVSQTTLDGFWNNLGVQTNINNNVYMSDPRVIFDPSTNRWFTSAITTAAVNQIDLAVSKGPNPAAGFTAVAVQAPPGQFADFPMLGVNHAAVTIGTNDFSATSGYYTNSALLSILKSDLINGTPTTKNATEFNNLSTLYFAPEPVTDSRGAGTGTTVLASLNNPNIAGFNGVGALNISNAGTGNPALSTGPSYPNPLDIAGLINPVQPGGTPYDSNDPRISSGPVQVGNLIYFTNSAFSGGNDVVYWGVLNATNESLVRSGLVSVPGLQLTFPSIAANGDGTFVISFNGSGPDTDISAYDVVCSEFTGACGSATGIYAGTGDNYTGYGYQRWGDYSWTTVDPYNSDDFWLFQDYVTSANLWGTVITEINVPEPGSLLLLATGLIGLAALRRR